MRGRCRRAAALALLLLILLAGCARPWSIEVSWKGGSLGAITDERWREWAETFAAEVVDEHALPLERALWEMGITAIETLSVDDAAAIDWAEVADDAWLRDDGRIVLNGEERTAATVTVTSPPEEALVTAHVTDVAPTICRALGIGAPATATGTALDAPSTERAVFIFIGAWAIGYAAARERSLMPYLDSLASPIWRWVSIPADPRDQRRVSHRRHARGERRAQPQRARHRRRDAAHVLVVTV